jgi:hypothetical protein
LAGYEFEEMKDAVELAAGVAAEDDKAMGGVFRF